MSDLVTLQISHNAAKQLPCLRPPTRTCFYTCKLLLRLCFFNSLCIGLAVYQTVSRNVHALMLIFIADFVKECGSSSAGACDSALCTTRHWQVFCFPVVSPTFSDSRASFISTEIRSVTSSKRRTLFEG